MLSWSSLREAEEALADGGDLEKDQLGRVTLLGFIRWCRLREKRRLEAEVRRRNPPPPWKERLKHWRKVKNKDAKSTRIVQVYFHGYRFSRRSGLPIALLLHTILCFLFPDTRKIPTGFLCGHELRMPPALDQLCLALVQSSILSWL